MLPLFPTKKNLRTNVCQVLHWWHMPCQNFIHCHRFPNRKIKIEFEFFFNVEYGRSVLWITDIFSPEINDSPKFGTPIMRSLYRNPRSFSIPIFITTNSAPNTEVTIVAYLLDNKAIGALFRKIMYAVMDILVILSPAWSESTIILRSNSLPLVSGALVGIASFTSP